MSTEQKNPIEGQAEEEQQTDATNTEGTEVEAEEAGETTPESAELEQLRQQAEDNYQRFLRAQADFDNFRRRTRQEKEDFAKYASLKMIEQLLPVVDNFERALAAGKESSDHEALLKGVEMIFRQFDSVLASEGLQPMNAVGQPFNPEFHQAIMQVESDEYEEGIVVEEVQKGYMLKDKVVRPAMVKVSS